MTPKLPENVINSKFCQASAISWVEPVCCLLMLVQKAVCYFWGGGGESQPNPKGHCARLVGKWWGRTAGIRSRPTKRPRNKKTHSKQKSFYKVFILCMTIDPFGKAALRALQTSVSFWWGIIPPRLLDRKLKRGGEWRRVICNESNNIISVSAFTPYSS